MKILNLYCGIGGNRKLWGDSHEITAIELNPEIAKIYQDFFPNDTVIVTDAHQYLLDHYKEFDFIWSSPPCPTHSNLRLLSVNRGLIDMKYPDMTLYQEIILMQSFCKTKYVIENVMPYYKPLIIPQASGRHCFWTNFKIGNIKTDHIPIKNRNDIKLKDRAVDLGYEIKDWHNYKGDKHKLYKNCVKPELGKYILNTMLDIQEPIQEGLFENISHTNKQT